VQRAGDVVGSGFVLESMLGEGASGQVWLATKDGEQVAIKILRAELRIQPRVLDRFRREVMLLQKIAHPGIPRLIEADMGEDVAYVAMALARGGTLAEWLQKKSAAGVWPAASEIETILRGIADALGHAHLKGIVHRDLKPGNVAYDDATQSVMLLDLGLAKQLDDVQGHQTTVGRVMGTPYYLAPEQIRAEPVGPATDIFALTTLAFELYTLRRAWGRDGEDRPLSLSARVTSGDPWNTALAVTQRILSGLRPKVSALRPDLNPSIDDAFALGWTQDPTVRVRTPDAWLDVLRRASSGLKVREPTGIPAASTAAARPTEAKTMPSQDGIEIVEPTLVRVEKTDLTMAVPSPGTVTMERPRKKSRAPYTVVGLAAALAITAALMPTRDREPAAPSPVPVPVPMVSVVPAPQPTPEPTVPPPRPIATPRPRSTPTPTPTPTPVLAAPKPVDRLDAMLADLEAHPTDGGKLSALVEAIQARSESLSTSDKRSVGGAARRALFGGGANQARVALEALRRAEGSR